MSTSLRTHKILWSKLGNRCAFPECRCELAIDEFDILTSSVIGEEAHVIGRKANGPRGDKPFRH